MRQVLLAAFPFILLSVILLLSSDMQGGKTDCGEDFFSFLETVRKLDKNNFETAYPSARKTSGTECDTFIVRGLSLAGNPCTASVSFPSNGSEPSISATATHGKLHTSVGKTMAKHTDDLVKLLKSDPTEIEITLKFISNDN